MKKLLIIVDMQNDFIDGSLANEDAKKIVPGIVDFVHGWDGSILVTLDTHTENYLETQEGKNLPYKHCILNTHGHELNKDIKTAIFSKGNNFYTAIQKNSFGYNEWITHSSIKTVDEIVMVGTCTDICVITNALLIKAAFPEVKIKVVGSLCAGLTKEKHEAALEVMRSCQIEII